MNKSESATVVIIDEKEESGISKDVKADAIKAYIVMSKETE